MSRLSDNLTARRKALGMSVPDVHAALGRLGVDVAFSTVASWLNGTRSVRKMEHLQALCKVLQTDLNTITGGEIEIADNQVEAQILRDLRDVSPAQRELVLALVRSLKTTGGA